MMSTIPVSVDNNFEPQSTLVWLSLPQSNSTKKPYLLISASLPEELNSKNQLLKLNYMFAEKLIGMML